MNHFKTKSSSIAKLAIAWTGVLILFSVAFTVPTGAAFADTPPTPAPKTRTYTGLAQAYQREQNNLSRQQNDLSNANGLVSKLQNRISDAEAKGIDTSALSSALTTFQAQLATAQGDNSTAASILSSHNGFDGSGNVTNPSAASETVRDAHQSLTDAHNALSQGIHDLNAAVKAWEEANNANHQQQDLTKSYQNEQKWLTDQQNHLADANKLVTEIQNLISQAQGKGLDTTALSSALATFQSQLSNVQSSDTTAANVLSAHNGFDGSGNVTDQALATQTVNDAHQSLQDARDIITQATSDLKKAVDAWRDQNHISRPHTDGNRVLIGEIDMNKKLLFASVLLAISLTMFACRLTSNGVSGAQSGSDTTSPLLSQPTSQAGAGQQQEASGSVIASPSSQSGVSPAECHACHSRSIG